VVAFSVKWKSVLGVLIVIIVAVSGASLYILSSLTPICGTTRIVEYSVSYNNTDNSVFLNVTSWVNKTYVFDEAVIKDSKGQVVVSTDFFPTELPAYGTIDLTINVGSVVLSSGQSYNVELYTTDGDSYKSVLTVYENVKTRVSLVNANTLLVDVQSFANQTIDFESATINDFGRNQYNYGSPSFSQFPENTVLSQAKLLPNENLSFTILYEQGFSPGNYTFFLYSSSPKSQYVSGAWAFFTITGLENCFNQVATIQRIVIDSADNGKLLVDVHSLTEDTLLFTAATLKESISVPAGRYYAIAANGELPLIEVPSHGNSTITVNFLLHQSEFGSGNYTITLFSEGNAVWAPFLIPIT
jgi:hypothetical protein